MPTGRLSRGTSLLNVLAASLAASASLAGASSPPASSPEAPSDADLICHVLRPGDEPDCYPRVFRPTDEFQPLRDDQELPKRPPLHVRLNVATGKREAKINVPGEGVDPALAGLPVERAVVVVDQGVEDEGDGGREGDQAHLPKGAPAYDPVGKVKEPHGQRGHEAVTFADTFRLLKGSGGPGGDGRGERDEDEDEDEDDSALDRGLEGMEELSHDIFYGLQIAEDPEVVKALFCLMSGGDPRAGSSSSSSSSSKANDRGSGIANKGKGAQGKGGQGAAAVPRDQQAAAILAGALSNNPKALGEVGKLWAGMMGGPACPGAQRPLLRDSFYASLTSARQSPAMVKARVAAVRHLIQDASIRADFLRRGGMKQLLEVLLVVPDPDLEVESKERAGKGKEDTMARAEGAEWSAAQRKVGQLVLDTFLDEDMGAQPGQWPRGPRLDDATCRRPESAADEGCWDFHVAKIAAAHRGVGGHWSRELERSLARAREDDSGSGSSSSSSGEPGASGHDEL